MLGTSFIEFKLVCIILSEAEFPPTETRKTIRACDSRTRSHVSSEARNFNLDRVQAEGPLRERQGVAAKDRRRDDEREGDAVEAGSPLVPSTHLHSEEEVTRTVPCADNRFEGVREVCPGI